MKRLQSWGLLGKKKLIHHLKTKRWSWIVFPAVVLWTSLFWITKLFRSAQWKQSSPPFKQIMVPLWRNLLPFYFLWPSSLPPCFKIWASRGAYTTDWDYHRFQREATCKNPYTAHMQRLIASTFIYRSFQNKINIVWWYVNGDLHIKLSEVCFILVDLIMKQHNPNRSYRSSPRYFANMFLMFVCSGHLL